MRTRDLLRAVVLLLFGAGLLWAQKGKTRVAPTENRSAYLLAELSRSPYTAKRPIPASEDIFIDNGQLIEALFKLTAKEKPVAIQGGKTAQVSRVLLLDKALQIYFDNKCALIVITKDDQLVVQMTPQQLLDLAREGIAALFATEGDQNRPRPVT